MSQERSLIAQIGRTVGLSGDLKFHIHTDFPEQFKVGTTYQSNRGALTIADINLARGTIRFKGYESVESAKQLTNVKLFANEEETKANITLKEGEYFWFDIIGCSVKEGDEVLGHIEEIQRMADTDYLSIVTEKHLVESGMPKHFLLPYIDRYIVKVVLEEKTLYAKDAKDILAAS